MITDQYRGGIDMTKVKYSRISLFGMAHPPISRS